MTDTWLPALASIAPSQTQVVFVQTALVLILAAAIGFVGSKLKQPLIVSFIAVGILVGPYGLDLIKDPHALELLAEIGICILLFIVGLKLDLAMVRTMGRVALATGLGQVVFTSIGGFALARLLGMEITASVYVAVYVTVVAFSLPGAFVMTVTGGFLFGLFPGVPLAVISATLGATLIFLAAKAGLGEALHARLRAQGGQGFFARIEAGLRENQVSYLLLMRLVPAVPFVVANLAPAFLGVSLRIFFLTTLFGILPGTFITTWIGVGVGEVFDRGETPGAGLILEPHILGPILGLCALAALPILLKHRRRGRARP